MTYSDAELDQLSAQQLRAELLRVRKAVATDAQRQMHDLCWDRSELWASVLPDYAGTSASVPPVSAFLGNCLKYRLSMRSPLVNELQLLAAQPQLQFQHLRDDGMFLNPLVMSELQEAGLTVTTALKQPLIECELRCDAHAELQLAERVEWTFRRCADYYLAVGEGIPSYAAELLHRHFAADLHACGVAGRSPIELAGNFSVSTYYARSKRALRALVVLLNGLKHEPASITLAEPSKPPDIAQPEVLAGNMAKGRLVFMVHAGELVVAWGHLRPAAGEPYGIAEQGIVYWRMGDGAAPLPLLQRWHSELVARKPELAEWKVYNGGKLAPPLRSSQIVEDD